MFTLKLPAILTLAAACFAVIAAPTVWVVSPPAVASSASLDQTKPVAPVIPVGTRLYWNVQGHRGPVDYPVAAPGQVCDCSAAVVEDAGTFCTLPQWPRRLVQCEVK